MSCDRLILPHRVDVPGEPVTVHGLSIDQACDEACSEAQHAHDQQDTRDDDARPRVFGSHHIDVAADDRRVARCYRIGKCSMLAYSALSSSMTSLTDFLASPNSIDVCSAVNSGLSMPA